MNFRVLKRAILLLYIVFSLFSFNSCKTIKAAVSFKWGQWRGNGYPHEVAKGQKEVAPSDWVAMMNTE